WLNREMRFNPAAKGRGLFGAYLGGLAFAFGWTPCIGPILATILTIACSRDSLGYGIGLLTAYALGLGVPFLAAAYAIKPFLGFMRRFRQHLHRVEIGAGALLIATGVLVFTNNLGQFGYYLLEAFPALGRIGRAASFPRGRANHRSARRPRVRCRGYAVAARTWKSPR